MVGTQTQEDRSIVKEEKEVKVERKEERIRMMRRVKVRLWTQC